MDYYAETSSHCSRSSTGNQRIESWWSFFRRGRYCSRDCGFAVEERELDVFPVARQATELCGDQNIEEYLQQAVQQNGLQKPQD
ncbi:hypothetical protein CHARACLAT_023419 [Characodon lateralis]|uniref:Uncharacterized protein n=1 Tax=Characodon lateralis TaxID=208331 RepID=A0ABU7DUW9_9TELE|nr:hypothetical protein [Characodon lateralis]